MKNFLLGIPWCITGSATQLPEYKVNFLPFRSTSIPQGKKILGALAALHSETQFVKRGKEFISVLYYVMEPST
jgi:hypothetical protein